MRTEIITNRFTEKIYQLTGIRVAPEDMKLHVAPTSISVSVWNKPLKTVAYHYISDIFSADQIILSFMNPLKDFRKALIDAQIYRLADFIPKWHIEIKETLIQQNISPAILNSFQYRIVNNTDHAASQHHDGHYDYPNLALEIKGHKGFKFSSLLNVYDKEDPLDIEFLKENLFIAIIENSLTQGGWFE